ncbi:ABC transporter ATP-binding protein [Thalassobaculum salexigens]|uniref:ABC transporter ATP-binding protein n=1 Tax=Thalassobaculum salexigens TaxID=455360 RepID=UPI0003FD10F9|nr:ABC transporter ATP-binding protein [Thalassobaculum salexigens]
MSIAEDTADTRSVPSSSPAIELIGIEKRFGPVQANRDVSLSVAPGTIHGIVGENGAGKSTLMSILYGFYEADSGEIRIDGRRVTIRNAKDAIRAGIGMVHQHFMLVPPFTVVENVMLGAEGAPLLAAGIGAARAELLRLGREYGLEIDPDAIVGELPVGLQQRVEILKALYRGARILILDEPTGVLTPQETDQLFEILRELKREGVTVILITHKLREILAVTDTVSVMRRGEMVAHRPTAQTSRGELAELMVGRKVLFRVDKGPASPGAPLLSVAGLGVVDSAGVTRLHDVSFTVRAGEIVGLAGVSGNGQSELLEVLAGLRTPTTGTVRLDDLEIAPDRPSNGAAVRAAGVGHVPEDRHAMGMVMDFDAKESAILGHHTDDRYNAGVLTDPGAIEEACRAKMEGFDVRPPDPSLKSSLFSGGNQQKLVLARELDGDPKILLVGQPTRGVDIGAIEFIHRQLVAMRDAGAAILLVSVELDEIMGLSDRILVMCGGALVGELPADEADERTLGLMMANVPLSEIRAQGRTQGDPA